MVEKKKKKKPEKSKLRTLDEALEILKLKPKIEKEIK